MPKETFFNLPIEKQDKIMRAAISEFIKHGFEKGNIGEIAKDAGVAKGSMYQYFENKRELFLAAVKWSLELLLKKFDKFITIQDKNTDIFEFLSQNSRNSMLQMREERDVAVFVQDVFLGKYQGVTDESLEYMLKLSDEYILNLIKIGKGNGSIRYDIDDHILSLFITGVTFKIKEYMMVKARNLGEDIIDEDYEVYEKDINAMIDLIRNGMGGR